MNLTGLARRIFELVAFAKCTDEPRRDPVQHAGRVRTFGEN